MRFSMERKSVGLSKIMVCKPEHSSHRACSQHKQPATISELICSRKPRVNSVQELGGSFKCITSPVNPRPAAIPSGSWYFMNSSKPWDESHNFGQLIHRAFRQPSSRLLSSLLHRAGRTAHQVKFSERGIGCQMPVVTSQVWLFDLTMSPWSVMLSVPYVCHLFTACYFVKTL
jgi:hypothetical protein